jgi:hypothetical protein
MSWSSQVNGVLGSGVAARRCCTSELLDGAWTAPRPLRLFPGQTRAVADDMTVSANGRELYFLGNHPHAHDGSVRSADIWRSTRINGKWSTAEVMPSPISTEASEVYPVVVRDSSLYFTSNRPGGLGRASLYKAQRLADGTFASPALVSPPINSEFGVGDAFASPDESYMVLSSGRPPSLGGGDLFVSYRRPGGGWSEATAGDVYWVDAKILEQFKR